MASAITFVGSELRTLGNQCCAITDYSFRVSDAHGDRYVDVGVTDHMRSVEAPKLSQEEVKKAAEMWLRSRIDKNFEEFSQVREGRTFCDLSRGLLGYWAEYQAMPDWL